jgi:superfamily I DNA/RNA helicase
MIEVKISGAGAGKTYGLSEKLINFSNNFPEKIIYAITYTNFAKRKISNTINERLGYIPCWICKQKFQYKLSYILINFILIIKFFYCLVI